MTGKKRILFWVLFCGSAAVIAVVPEFMAGNAPGVAPVARPAPLAGLRAAPAASMAPDGRHEETAAPAAVAAIDLFAAKSWHVPPAPAPVQAAAPAPAPAPAPPAPAAPPLPFRFMGKFDDANSVKVFLQREDKVYSVGVGDVIDGMYRVTGIAGGEITLTYLPLDIAQTLAAGNPL